MKIAGAIGLAAVTCGCASAGSASGDLPSALEAGWKGQSVCVQRHQTDTHRVLKCTFPPGVGHERHFHPPNYGYAISGGTMQLTDERGTRVAHIAAGSDFSSNGTAWHEAVNVGDTTVTYIIVEEL